MLLVAPRADYRGFPEAEIPPDVPRLTWEQTARSLATYAAPGPEGAFLVADLRSYLDEEGLVDPEQLTDDHLAALVHHQAALAALQRICEIAADEVELLWRAPALPSTYPERSPREYWWTYPPPPGGPPADGLEWSWALLLDGTDVFKDTRPGVPCLLAGFTGPAASIANLDAPVRHALRGRGLLVLGPGDSNSREWGYAVRVASPGHDRQVLAGADVDAQGRALAAWIAQAFREASSASRAS